MDRNELVALARDVADAWVRALLMGELKAADQLRATLEGLVSDVWRIREAQLRDEAAARRG